MISALQLLFVSMELVPVYFPVALFPFLNSELGKEDNSYLMTVGYPRVWIPGAHSFCGLELEAGFFLTLSGTHMHFHGSSGLVQ